MNPRCLTTQRGRQSQGVSLLQWVSRDGGHRGSVTRSLVTSRGEPTLSWDQPPVRKTLQWGAGQHCCQQPLPWHATHLQGCPALPSLPPHPHPKTQQCSKGRFKKGNTHLVYRMWQAKGMWVNWRGCSSTPLSVRALQPACRHATQPRLQSLDHKWPHTW